MSKLYNDLINIIDFELDKEEEIREEKQCKNENRIINILFWINIIFTGFAIFCILQKFIWGTLGIVVSAMISVNVIKSYRRKHIERVNFLINDECNFNKLLTVFMVRARYHVYNTKRSYILLSDVGNSLFYLGKFEDAKRTIDLIGKYCDTPEGNAYRVIFYAMLARFKMDKEAVENYIKELDTIMPQINTPYIIKAYANVSKYPLMMDVEEQGDYAKALEHLKENEKVSVLESVNINYRLYKVAKVAGMEKEASKHRAFVLEKGGDTFYKRELEKR